MQEERLPINSVRDLPDKISRIRDHLGARSAADLWFRGTYYSSYDRGTLQPKVFRSQGYAKAEYEFTQQFRLRAPALFPGCPDHDQYGAWLSLMQHYGLPTRLLDWTGSLLVAAFFATEKPMESSGGVQKENAQSAAIWVLNPKKLCRSMVGRERIYVLAAHKEFDPLHAIVHQAFQHLEDRSRLLKEYYKRITGRRDGERLKRFLDPKCLAVSPQHNDPRLAAQRSFFTIHADGKALEGYTDAKEFLDKIIVPHNVIDAFRKDLADLGVSKTTVYPDLSGLADELIERYADQPNGS